MEQRKEVLTFQIELTETIKVKGDFAEAEMILFGGTADCENFHGKVLPGGVDTQQEIYGENRRLSARYILEGIDRAGQQCRIFVENNGVAENGIIRETVPKIITDSRLLAYLQKAELTGNISPTPTGVAIHIFEKDC